MAALISENPVSVMIFFPLCSAALLACILGYFRLGDANANASRKPPLSGTVALLLASLILVYRLAFGIPMLMHSWSLNIWLISMILISLLIHHSEPHRRGKGGRFGYDPSSYPASISFVLSAFATLEFVIRLMDNGTILLPSYYYLLWAVSVFSLAQFSLFIYRKWHPI